MNKHEREVMEGLYWLVEQLQDRIPAPVFDAPELGLGAVLIKSDARRILGARK